MTVVEGQNEEGETVSQSSIPLAVEDYVFRGNDVENYSIYEIYTYATGEYMTSVKWERYEQGIIHVCLSDKLF